MGRKLVAVCLVAAACGKKPKLEGDIEIRLGDCASPTIGFVSGPRPQPFDPDQLGGEQTLLGKGAGAGFARFGSITGSTGIGTGIDTPPPERGPALPTVSIGQPNTQGDLDKAIIRRYIKRNIQKIQYCYEKELLAKPKLAGTVSTQFLIDESGNVKAATASGVDKNVAECVAGVIKNIEFPKPKGGGSVQVSYPFTFRQAGDTASNDKAPLFEKDDPPPPEDESGGTGTAMALDEAAEARRQAIEQARAAGILGQAGGTGTAMALDEGRMGRGPDLSYRAGSASPLRAVQAELVECFRWQSKRSGAAVIDIDAKGLVAHGIDGGDFKSCVKKLKLQEAKPLRCSVAFGATPIDIAAGVDITKDAIKLDGKTVANVAAVVADDSPTFKIDALFEAVEARVKAAIASKTPLTMQGPLVLRPLDSTPMKAVNKAYSSILAGGDNVLLAVQRDAKWALLRPLALPIEPVPWGTGGSWNGTWGSGDGTGAEEEAVHLSVLVTPDGVWVGLSRVNEFAKIDGNSLDKLETVLHDHKASAFFADRTDIEIAGEDKVTYDRVVNVIQLAEKLGFRDWELTDPRGLSAVPTL